MTIAELNDLEEPALAAELKKCCGSGKWVDTVVSHRPYKDYDDLLEKSDAAWELSIEEDFLEAFSHHPRIGDMEAIKEKYKTTAHWAEGEQASVKQTSEEVLTALAECNRLYEEKFGYIFIINATGKSAEEILGSLRWRLLNTPEDELKIAAEEQHAITKLRLKKLLA